MEARRALTANSISVNKEKVKRTLYSQRFNKQPVCTIAKRKKNYFVVRIV
jgi:tyrosyl-tRNA synthetase